MKKTYETPTIEVVQFQYRDQVVAASGCYVAYEHLGGNTCTGEKLEVTN